MLHVVFYYMFIHIITIHLIVKRKRIIRYVKILLYPLIGLAFTFFGQDEEGFFKKIVKLTRSVQSPVKTKFGPIQFTYVDKPEDIQIILNSANCIEKSFIYSFFHNETGLVTSAYSIWKLHRKLLNPTFNLKILQSFLDIFNLKTNVLCQEISKELKTNESFNIAPYIFRATLEMICETSLGWNIDVQRGKNVKYLEATEKLSCIVTRRIFSLWLYPDFIYKKTKMYKEEQEYFKCIYELSTEIIAKKKEEYKIEKNNETAIVDDENNNESRKPQIFVEQLFKLIESGQFTDLNLREHVDTIIITGNETSAMVTSNVILLLAMHEDIQEKVLNEIQQMYTGTNSYVSYEDTGKLVYMDMVIKEALRLYPVLPFLLRKCTAATKLNGKFTIPSGSQILMSIYNLHLNKKIWGENSELFNPDHFLPENVEKRHPYSYIPFSAGPRNCIGMRYAMISIKVMLVNLLKNYKFKTDLKYNDLRLKLGVTTKLINKHMVKVELRN